PGIADLPARPAEPLAFVPNRGQTDPRVRFQTHAAGAEVFFTPAEVVLALSGNGVDTSVVRVRFDGANPSPELAPGAQLPGVVNYYLGQNRAEWLTGLPTYDSVVYRELYPGVDVRYDGPAGALKSTYTVAPYADPSLIAWRYAGVAEVQLDAQGNLQIALGEDRAPLVERAPVAWQRLDGRRVPVAVRYTLRGDGSVGFALGSYDRAHPLPIDPTLELSSYLGGTEDDRIYAVEIDPAS